MTSIFNQVQALVEQYLTRFLCSILACGPIPQHVAFVMDGNRRYARIRGMEVSQGHGEGFESLKRNLEICFRLDVRCVSVYAFAIDNFSRPQEEVEAIMDLAKTSLRQLCEQGELLQKYDVRVNVLGRRDMLRDDVRYAIEELEDLTKDHTSFILNVCCPYASRDEIATAVKGTIAAFRSGEIEEIDSSAIEARLSTSLRKCPPLDILIRTSDVRRLSDFMLWQCSSGTQIQFVKTFWPEFGLKDMLPILLSFQQKLYMSRIR